MTRTHSYNIADHIAGEGVLTGFVLAVAASDLPADSTLADLLQLTYDNGRRDGSRSTPAESSAS